MSADQIESKELQSMELNELVAELDKACKSQFELTMKHRTGSLKETHLVRQGRRQIARLNTVIQSKRTQK